MSVPRVVYAPIIMERWGRKTSAPAWNIHTHALAVRLLLFHSFSFPAFQACLWKNLVTMLQRSLPHISRSWSHMASLVYEGCDHHGRHGSLVAEHPIGILKGPGYLQQRNCRELRWARPCCLNPQRAACCQFGIKAARGAGCGLTESKLQLDKQSKSCAVCMVSIASWCGKSTLYGHMLAQTAWPQDLDATGGGGTCMNVRQAKSLVTENTSGKLECDCLISF